MSDQLGARRTLRVWKTRAMPSLLGEHGFTITGDGLTVYPRAETRALPVAPSRRPARVSSGSAELDRMMDGGLPTGSTTVVAGARRSGKTTLGLQFLLNGARAGERGVLVALREGPEQLVAKARALGLELEASLAGDLVRIVQPPFSRSNADELLGQLHSALENWQPKRIVIDGGVELQQHVFPPARIPMVCRFTAELMRAYGATCVVAGAAAQACDSDLDGLTSALASTADNLIVLGAVQESGHRRLSVTMRDSTNEPSPRAYELVTGQGLQVLSAAATADGRPRLE